MSSRGEKQISILFPFYEDTVYKQLSPVACHDLGLDTLCSKLAQNPKEQALMMSIISNMTNDPRVAKYRQKVFVDVLNLPSMRKTIMDLLDHIMFLKDYGAMKKDADEKLGIWDLLHRMEEIDDYIKTVEAIRECLSGADIKSEGMISLRDYIDSIYSEACFAEMKKDISELKAQTSDIQSVTVGINLNSRFEATSLGLISVNNKQFKKSNVISNFTDAIVSRDKIHDGTDWNGDMHYHQVDKEGSNIGGKIEKLGAYMALQSAPFVDSRIRSSIVSVPENDGTESATFYLDKVVNKMLDITVKRLREIISKYVNIAIVNITKLIPEFMYYIRFAEFIESCMSKGMAFCEASIIEEQGNSGLRMDAKGLYNLKLATSLNKGNEVVDNDLVFDDEHTAYILTGANRGGKTTITQAVGILFVLAQGGIYVPCKEFRYVPVDSIFTHFPADEDKTLDLGRLGEECVRFKEIYKDATSDSLMLLNETFSTTSFEEGYYIACDSVKAIINKGIRTIYNTHMHKLAYDAGQINESSSKYKASSLVVKNEGANRSFKVEVAPPEGLSYARDIAEKYGVTFEMLTE